MQLDAREVLDLDKVGRVALQELPLDPFPWQEYHNGSKLFHQILSPNMPKQSKTPFFWAEFLKPVWPVSIPTFYAKRHAVRRQRRARADGESAADWDGWLREQQGSGALVKQTIRKENIWFQGVFTCLFMVVHVFLLLAITCVWMKCGNTDSPCM